MCRLKVSQSRCYPITRNQTLLQSFHVPSKTYRVFSMRWNYEEIDGLDRGETHTGAKPSKSDRLEFADGREWLVDRITIYCRPWPITESAPIVGLLYLRRIP